MPTWVLGRNELAPERPAHLDRIVSLAPSLTENVLALGLGEALIGVSDECLDLYEDDLEETPALSLGSYRDLDEGVLAAVNPDLVIGDALVNRNENLTAIERQGFALGMARVGGLEAAGTFITELGELLGRSAAAVSLRQEIDELCDRTAAIEPEGPEVGVLCPWEPGRCLGEGSYPMELVRRAGGRPLVWEGSLDAEVLASNHPKARLLWPGEPGPVPDELCELRSLRAIPWRALFSFGAGSPAGWQAVAAQLRAD